MLGIAQGESEALASNGEGFLTQLLEQVLCGEGLGMKTHIFLDNSNIFGGAQRVAAEREQAPWPCVRVDYENLFRVLRHGKMNSGISMLAGSVPPGNDALWAAAQKAGFDTTLLRRVENDDGRLVEQGVDEAIHLRIGNLLLDAPVPERIVIATGDGRQTEQDCSFTDQVRRAATRGWNVEIWSWRVQLAPRLRDMRLRYPDLVKVFLFDEWYHSLVFLKGGTWTVKGVSTVVATRTCRGLSMTETTFAEAEKLGRETTAESSTGKG